MTSNKITVGRSIECDLVLADMTVSRHHAEIELLENSDLLLTDCQSTQGTYFIRSGHEEKIRQQIILKSDLLKFGAITISVKEILNATGLCGVDIPSKLRTQVPEIKPQEYAPSKTDNRSCEVQLAKKSTRLLAAMIDLIVFTASFTLPFILASWIGGDISSTLKTSSGMVGVTAVVFLLVAPVQLYLLSKHGQTIGKRVIGIKIVREVDNGLPGLVKVCLLRSLVPNLLYGIPYAGAVIWLADMLFIFRDDRRCLHDLIAQTKVVNDTYKQPPHIEENNLIAQSLPIIFGIGFVVWAIAQFIAGYDGITSYMSSGWAIAAILVGFIFRFTLPITIGAFYGALMVWGWPWYLALLFTVPGLALIVPSALLSVYNFIRGR